MSLQLDPKFLANDTVDGEKIRIKKDQALKGENQAGEEVNLLKLDASNVPQILDQEVGFKSQIDTVQSNLDTEVSDRIAADALKVAKAGDSMTGKLAINVGEDFGETAAIETKGFMHIKPVVEGEDPDAGIKMYVYSNEEQGHVSSEINLKESAFGKPSMNITNKGFFFGAPASADNGNQELFVSLSEFEGLSISRGFDQQTFQPIPFTPATSNELTPKHYVDSADTALSGRLDALELDSVTKAYVDSADSALDAKITTEKERVDAILSLSDADKDSFKEIVDLINSVDAENDTAFAGYVTSNNARSTQIEADLAQEVSDRTSEDLRIEGLVSDEVARATAAEQLLTSSLNNVSSSLTTDIQNEAAARVAGDDALDQRLSAIEQKLEIQDEMYEVDGSNVLVDSITLPYGAQVIYKVCIGRLNAFKDVDYTVTLNEFGNTIITWIGELAQAGVSPIAVGDKIFVSYRTY